MSGGLLGLNTRVLGVSRDMIVSAVRQSGCAFVLVQDDPELVAQLTAQGVQCVYRQSGDDPAGNPLAQDPAAFVAERARNAPMAAYVHLTNELDEPTPVLLDWTLEAMRYAYAVGVKVCLFNFSTNRDVSVWNACAPIIREAVAKGHAIGLHAYFDGDASHDAGAWAWQALKRAVGGLWIVTEFAYIRTIFDGGKGWRGFISEAEYAAFLRKYVPPFAAEQMPLCLFSFDDWPLGMYPDGSEKKDSGFGVWNAPALLGAMADLNAVFPFKGTAMPRIPSPLGDPFFTFVAYPAGLNLRAAPTTQAAILRKIPKGEAVTVYLSPRTVADGYTFVWLTDAQGNAGYGALAVNGLLGFNPPVPAVDVTPVPPFRLVSPLLNGVITSRFNEPRDYGRHEGTDFALAPNPCAIGDVWVTACADGVVDSVRNFQTARAMGKALTNYGVYVRLKHVIGADVWFTWACHLSAELVCVGQQVKQGEPIGILGTTGNSSNYHTHITLQHIGHGLAGYVLPDVVDPELYLDK